MLALRAAAVTFMLGFAVVGCKKQAEPEYRLSAEQLAWQPYHAGDELRFGQARSSRVRTFAITDVDDRIVTRCNCGGIPVLGGPTGSKLQQIRVDVRRTDTVRYVRTSNSTTSKPDSVPLTGSSILLAMRLDDDHGSGSAVLQSEIGWDFGFYNYLPIQEIVANQALPDTAARVLPSLRIGGVTYGPVIQLSNSLFTAANLPPRTKPIRRLYYAKGVGVVGFLEGSTLWYRLP